MGKIINFYATAKPSKLLRNMVEHSGDVSEGTRFNVLAKRLIINRKVTFYSNGLRFIEGTDLDEQETHDSEILRLAHASILINAPVGDKRCCWVDATKNPVEIWVYGMTIQQFLATSNRLVRTQDLGVEFLLEEPIKKTVELKNGRNVRLFRKQPRYTHLSHKLLEQTKCTGDMSADNSGR